MANAPRDDNRVTTIIGVSSVDFLTPTLIAVDPTTRHLQVDSTTTLLARTTLPTSVSNGSPVSSMADKFGRGIVVAQAPRELIGQQYTTITNSTTETTIVTAGGANVLCDLLSIICINTSATATRVDFKDATAGTTRFAFYLPAGDTRGVVFQVPEPQAAANNNWTATCGNGVTDIRIYAQFVNNQ